MSASRPTRKAQRGRGARARTGGSPHAAPGASGHERGDALGAARDRAALAAALDPVVTIDARGEILSASDSVERVLGWRPVELLGLNVSVLMPEPHRSAHDGYLANYERTGRTNIMNRPRRFDAQHRNGARVPIELCVSQADVPGGTRVYVGIIRDMSVAAAEERSREEERVRSQQQLAEQTAALQTAHLRLRMADRMASIGTLAAGLGHDMNNVLMPVRARLNALRAAGVGGRLLVAESKHVEEIARGIAYLQQLADGLHYLALDPEIDEDARGGGAETDIRQWWSQTGTLLSKAVPKHVRVTAQFPEGLPPVGLASHGLTQAVLNLVVNAGEAIPKPSVRKRRQGLVRIWAEVRPGPGGPQVCLGVTDNGTGMSDEVRVRAAEMFFTTKPRGLGTGLGLALVHKVVERAGGRIEIESQVGKGTSVLMFLPVRERGSGRGMGASAAVSIADGRTGSMIRQLLSMSGVEVVAEGGESGAGIWVAEPGLVGYRALSRWKNAGRGRRVVLFGVPGAAAPGEWKSLGAVVITRPDDFENVRSSLGRAVAASERERSR